MLFISFILKREAMHPAFRAFSSHEEIFSEAHHPVGVAIFELRMSCNGFAVCEDPNGARVITWLEARAVATLDPDILVADGSRGPRGEPDPKNLA